MNRHLLSVFHRKNRQRGHEEGQNMKFSIITVCLNAGNDLLTTAESCLGQRYDDFELIVKDGLSRDGSVERLPAHPRLRLVRTADRGVYDAMNQGVALARGDYLLFINAGDALHGDSTLAALAKHMARTPADLYYGQSYNAKLGVFHNTPRKLTPFFCYRSMLCHQSMIFSRRCFQERAYDTRYDISADHELLIWLVTASGLSSAYVPLVIARYQGGGLSDRPESRSRIREEHAQMLAQHYSPKQRLCYGLRRALTFPWLRQSIIKNPLCLRAYMRLVGALYRTQPERG